MDHQQPYFKSVFINATPAAIWHVLTDIETIKNWMAIPEMQLDIETDWQVGHPITFQGFHHIPFENKGLILEVDKERTLSYTQLSSLSRLPDEPGSYSTFVFQVQPATNATLLTLTITNFPTYAIFKHLQFYWNVTLELLKQSIEKQVMVAE